VQQENGEVRTMIIDLNT